MKTFTIGSLFDGSGTAPLAATMLGGTPLWASEIEPYPIAVTKARFPNMKHFGDITEINGAEVPPVDIICGGSPCFPEGTLVLTKAGYKPIETIKEDDEVLTHTGKWRRVLKTGSKISNTIILKGQGHYGIECTPEHPFYAAKRYWTYRASESRSPNSRSGVRKLSAPTWTEAKDMVGKMWATPNKIEEVPIPPIEKKSVFCSDPPEMNEAFWWVVGRWLGDGWTRNARRKDRREGCTHGNVFICCGDYRKDGLKEKLDSAISGWCESEDDGSSSKFRIIHTGFADWLDTYFGKYAYGKRIPSFCFSMKNSFRQSLLDGICTSDGYAYKKNAYKITTVGKELALGIRLLSEGLGYATSLWKSEMPPTCVIEGRECSQRDQYEVSLTKNCRTNGMRTEDHSWYIAREIKHGKSNVLVYNLEVEDDNSYVVENIVVHNCQDLSVAGKQAGLENGTRSNMFYEMTRIIREMRGATNGKYPRFVVWENVPGAFSSNKGRDFLAVVEAFCAIADIGVHIPRPTEDKTGRLTWKNAGTVLGDGWSFAWRILDAQYWGVPQRRRRIFAVLDFGSECAGEILFERTRLPWDSEPSGEAGQGAATDAVGRADRGGGVRCLNPHDSQTMRVYDADGIYPALAANSGGGQNRQAVIYPVGAFCAGAAPAAGSIGYSESVAPTLKAAQCAFPMPAIVYALQGNGIDRALTAGCNGAGWREGEMYTLNTIDRPAVVYDARGNGNGETVPTLTGDHQNRVTDYTSLVAYGVDCRNGALNEDLSPTMQAKANGGQSLNYMPPVLMESAQAKPPRRYIVRRLTPTECARLQGFPDWWVDGIAVPNPTEEDIVFWTEAWETYRKVMNPEGKRKTRKQIVKWLHDPGSDSNKYKMWGNGMALPCVLAILNGIVGSRDNTMTGNV